MTKQEITHISQAYRRLDEGNISICRTWLFMYVRYVRHVNFAALGIEAFPFVYPFVYNRKKPFCPLSIQKTEESLAFSAFSNHEQE